MAFRNKADKQRYHRDWHSRNKGWRNPQRYRRSKLERADRKRRLWTIKAACGCLKCGFNNPAALQFHHRDHHDKVFNVSNAMNKSYSWAKVLKEIEKCDVLCANCHCIETDKNRPWAVAEQPNGEQVAALLLPFEDIGM